MAKIGCVLFLVLIFYSPQIVGQDNDCERTLNVATAEFEAGHFYSLPNILKSCLQRGFSKEQRVRAYLLLTQAYLVLDKHALAEKSYLQVLNANPEFVADPKRDPIDVYYLSKQFTTTPIFTPQLRIGLNASLPRYIHNISTSSNPTSTSFNKAFNIGFFVGGGVDWNISDRWSIGLGLAYSRKNFKTIAHDNYAQQQLTGTEKQDWFDIPLYLKYSYDSGKFRPFVYAGFAANLLIGARFTPDRIDFNSPTFGSQKTSQGADFSVTPMRNMFNRSLILGGGLKYKIGKNFLIGEVRYLAGLSNVVKSVYTVNGQLAPGVVQYGYASPLYRIDNFSVLIGFVRPLYNPRKKKKAVPSLIDELNIKKTSK